MNQTVAKILLEFTTLVEITRLMDQKDNAVKTQDFASAAIFREKETELRKSMMPFEDLQKLKIELLNIINESKMSKAAYIYFNPQEVVAMAMALGALIEDLNTVAKDPRIPWTPEARKDQKDIVAAAKSAAAKLEKFTGVKCDLPPYLPGDENEFSTKES